MKVFKRSSSIFDLLKMISFIKSALAPCHRVCRSSNFLSCLQGQNRTFSDEPPKEVTPAKKVISSLVTGNEDWQRLRVRRTRPSDTPKVLRFVRDHSSTTWPNLLGTHIPPGAASQLLLADYVSRILAQGHSMVAEQTGAKQGWLTLRGLALGAAICPWDAAIMERWAKCLKCSRSRKLIYFTAHCLKAPSLHDKYRVHRLLQIILIIPPESLACPDIIQKLAKAIIQRGREVGFPLMRFDVTNHEVAKALEDLPLHKEWHLSYDVLPETMSKKEANHLARRSEELEDERGGDSKNKFISVYTVLSEDLN